jgi:hypothetical protein
MVFTGGDDGTVRVWDMAEMRQADMLELGGKVFALEVSQGGFLVVGAGGEVIAFEHWEGAAGRAGSSVGPHPAAPEAEPEISGRV